MVPFIKFYWMKYPIKYNILKKIIHPVKNFIRGIITSTFSTFSTFRKGGAKTMIPKSNKYSFTTEYLLYSIFEESSNGFANGGRTPSSSLYFVIFRGPQNPDDLHCFVIRGDQGAGLADNSESGWMNWICEVVVAPCCGACPPGSTRAEASSPGDSSHTGFCGSSRRQAS